MLSRAEEKLVRGLARRRVREREGLFLAEGVRVVEELLDAGIVLRLVLRSSSLGDTDRGRGLARRLDAAAPVRELPTGSLNELADTTSGQGVLVVAETPAAALSALEPAGASVVVVLDGLQDPGNVGTIARSAAAFGCDLVAWLPGTVDPWNPKAVRASAGSLFRLPVVRADPDRLWEWLGRQGFIVLGADAAGAPIESAVVSQRVALVVGNEGAGLSSAVAERCDAHVAVPMRGGTESLNVAVAAAILLYTMTRERG